jgi:predicted dehydrogenase
LTEKNIKVAVAGVGDFGRNHVRVWKELEGVELVGVLDANAERAQKVAEEFATVVLKDFDDLAARAQAVSLAVPTAEHARIGCELLQRGLDVLVEKPIAASLTEADALLAAAIRNNRILQVGHLERFNPAVIAAEKIISRPLFFEIHRMGVFSPRSLDIDVVYDVMIHDLEILLAFVPGPVADLRAVGIPVLTDKVDIAHARIEFETGAVANLTASRVSTERVRKMRFFQEHEYVSIDFTRQDVLRVQVDPPAARAPGAPVELPMPRFETLGSGHEEPLLAELRAFADSVRTRQTPRVDGVVGRRALELADRVMAGILEHSRRVQHSTFAPQDTR